MKIHLVSRDRLVEKLCREGLAKFCGAGWTLYLDPDLRREENADLAIVDLESCPSSGVQPEPRNGAGLILLYDQKQILTMRGPLPAATILLKPLHREVFLTVLGGVLEAQQAKRDAGDATALSQRDPLPPGDPLPAGDPLLQQVQRTNLELQQVHARQMQLLSRGLHDLRAPLTAIEGYSRLLLAERFGPLTAAQRENLRRMQQSIGRLSRMTTDIFQLSLGERAAREPDLQPGDMVRSIRQVLDEMAPLAYSKAIRVVADVSPAGGVLNFDAEQIHNVLTNLIENACRFTPRRGSIEVRGNATFWERRQPEVRESAEQERRWHPSRRPNAYQVEVRDSGLGISTDHLQSIFEPYTSYAGSQDRGGSGLGLAICRMVVSAHRGTIFANSSEKGAAFSFVLPLAGQTAASGRRPPRADIAGSGAAPRADVAGESA